MTESPAFPTEPNTKAGFYRHHGISKREWYATHAPITMKEAWSIWTDDSRLPFGKTVAGGSERGPFMQWFARLRLEYADAMLKEADGEY